ncbi:MAG: preprotein translocase subunit SecA [Blastopirellula sp.]|nr:MAG: preprotein translocase subunit SecA [Blastopirellula sp.]
MSQVKNIYSAMLSTAIPFLNANQDAKLVAAIIASTNELSDLSDTQLLESSEQLRLAVCQKPKDDHPNIIQAFSLINESFRRVLGINLYQEQLTAALTLLNGTIAEMQTGEGKTFACAPTAYYHALSGQGVHVATTNAYLANRDHELLQPVYQLLGVTSAVLPEQASVNEKRDAYQCDITYGTAAEFGFDYLRDQLVLQQTNQRSLGSDLLEALSGASVKKTMQRGLHYVIIDEADHVLLDDAVSPLILSSYIGTEATDAEVYQAAKAVLNDLEEGHHYNLNGATSAISLTLAGETLIHKDEYRLPLSLLNRTWSEYVSLSIRASILRRNVHYIVDQEEKVQIVDSGSGRIYSDRTWQDGLHQSVEAKENVTISPEKTTMVQITKQRFFRMYAHAAGMTGTATGCERELRQVYDLDINTISLRTPSKREIWPQRVFLSLKHKRAAIVKSVCQLNQQNRPVLLGTLSVEESEFFAELLSDNEIEFQLLNGIQDESEAAIIAKAGQASMVTIATNLAGRGTDISLEPGVVLVGGLHVIVSECAESGRVDRQLIGRCARQGDPGSAQTFVSAEDSLIQQHGAWLVPILTRQANVDGEIDIELNVQIKRVQNSAQRFVYRSRCELFRQDLASELSK